MPIFRGKKSDLRQAIDAHLQNAPPDAPIREVLVSADIRTRLAEFDWADERALKEQWSYRRFRLLSLWAMMVGTVVGALFLLPIEQWIDGPPRVVFQVLQATALVLALLATVWVSMRQWVGQWLQARAVAERLRADVFRAVMRTGAESSRLLAPALALFRDAHLDWQLAFYGERGAQCRKSAGNTAPYRMVGYLLLALAVLLGSVGLMSLAVRFELRWAPLDVIMSWIRLEHPERWQLGLGAMATGILAFTSARSFMDLDDRNASFYAMAADELRRVRSAELPAAEAAVATGDAAAVMAFCENVQSILDAEHLAWALARPPGHPVSVSKLKA